MKVGIVGAGFVGLTIGAVFAEKGIEVTLIDVDERKIEKINNGIPPFFEKGLEERLKDGKDKKLIHATKDYSELKDAEIIFITVGTPSKEDGSIDLRYIESASRELSKILKESKEYKLVVVKSTVVPTTTEEKIIPILTESGKKIGEDFGVCMNPEFLREGTAVFDFLNQDRIVIGEYDKKSGDVLENFYSTYFPGSPIIRTDLKTAEMIKYTANSFLATKISFINEIGNICKKLGIDVYKVVDGIKYDKRIGPYFLNAGIGFGGSCFPKDVSALINFSENIGYEPNILKSVINLNNEQPLRVVEILENKMEIKNKTVGVLGLSFKPGTDDIRESRAIPIIEKLLDKGANVIVYDPMAKPPENLKDKIEIAFSLEEIIDKSHALIIATEWNEFKKLENMKEKLKGKIIIEGRKLLDKEKMGDVDVEGVCW